MPETQNQDVAALSAQFVEACFDFQVPSTRAAAEAVLTSFRQIPNVLPLFKHILDIAIDPMAQFQAALAIVDIVSRDYSLYALNDLIQLKDYMIQYCLEHISLRKFVRDQLLLGVSLIIKRSLFDIPKENMENALATVDQLFSMNTDHSCNLALALASALIDQFSSTKSTAVGLCYEYHHNCKIFYESRVLLPIFKMALARLHVIVELVNPQVMESSYSLLQEVLDLAEKTLSWNFESKHSSSTIQHVFKKLNMPERDYLADDDFSSAEKTSNTFPVAWRPVVGDCQVLDLFFKTYVLVHTHVSLGHQCGQCLVQLAGLTERFFDNDQNAFNLYSIKIIKGIMIMMEILLDGGNTNALEMEQGPQLLRTTQMIRQILQNLTLATLFNIPDLFEFLNLFSHLTIECLEDTVTDKDEDWINTACDESLQTWVHLSDIVQSMSPCENATNSGLSQEQSQYLTQYMSSTVYRIVEVFTDTRLKRAMLVLDNEEEEDEIDSGFKDWDTFSEQLTSVGILGRLNPQQTLIFLQHIVEDLFQQLQVDFKSNLASGGQTIILHFEKLHWVTMITGHVLADSGKGEQPMVPESLMQLSGSQNFEQDQVVNLSKQLLEIYRFTSSFGANSIEASNLTPRVAETLTWYMERWSKTYLFLNEDDYGFVSSNIGKAFGRPGPLEGQGILIVDFFIEMMMANFFIWNADPDVLLQIVQLLNTCGNSSNLKTGFLKSDGFPNLILFITRNLEQLPEAVHNSLIQVIMTIASGSKDTGKREHYFGLLFKTIEERLTSVISCLDLQATSQNGQVINNMLNALEMLDGLALASDYNNTREIFAFCSQFFTSFLPLMDHYRNVLEVQLAILQLFSDLAGRLDFGALEIEQKQALFETITKLLEIFGKINHGRKRIHSKEEMEDEAYTDISIVLVLLSNIMASEFEDFARNRGDIIDTANAVNAVLNGVNIVIPMIDLKMLKIPNICQQYIQLISHIVEVFPHKLVTLPPDLYNSLMASLKYGLGHDITSVNILTWRAVTSLANWAHAQKTNPAINDILGPSLSKFLWMLLQILLFEHLDSYVIDATSESLLALIRAQRDTYADMVREIIRQQKQPVEIQSRLLTAFGMLDKALPMDVLSRDDAPSQKPPYNNQPPF